jgi:hypothetical protein
MVPLAQIAKDWNLMGLAELSSEKGFSEFLGTLGIIPMYWGLLTPMAIFMYHGFVKGVPLSLEESAHIDGAGQFRTFFQVVFPMMAPITATIVILDVLWIWNDFLLPLVILREGDDSISDEGSGGSLWCSNGPFLGRISFVFFTNDSPLPLPAALHHQRDRRRSGEGLAFDSAAAQKKLL